MPMIPTQNPIGFSKSHTCLHCVKLTELLRSCLKPQFKHNCLIRRTTCRPIGRHTVRINSRFSFASIHIPTSCMCLKMTLGELPSCCTPFGHDVPGKERRVRGECAVSKCPAYLEGEHHGNQSLHRTKLAVYHDSNTTLIDILTIWLV